MNQPPPPGPIPSWNPDPPPASGGSTGDFLVRAPAVTLPRGGGALRGIGEKFTATPANGTASIAVPLPLSPGRSGFTPQLSLSYDSGAGNGPFGFGWSLSLPAIARKTDRGIPRYRDAGEPDVFILSGTEDLVPVLGGSGSRAVDTATAPGHEIERYRTRTEGLFARIERWTDALSREVHWRTTTRDNITTIYGATADARIEESGPAPGGGPPRVFSWLICESRDGRGNVIVYDYKREDGAGVAADRPHEANRRAAQRTTNRYLKRVRYGNTVSALDTARWPQNRWLFELVLDYGEHDAAAPAPGDGGTWLVRNDSFSSCRSGFEVRTYRLCQRLMMFHHFEREAGVGADCLVRSLDLAYRSDRGIASDARLGDPVASFIASITQAGYRRAAGGGYVRRASPALEFEYSRASINERVEVVDAASVESLPAGIDGSTRQWVDLFGEGVSGVLTEQGGAWFYTRNLTPAREPPRNAAPPVWLGATAVVGRRPNPGLLGGTAQLLDLEGDGQPDLVLLGGTMPGFFEVDEDDWAAFRPFRSRLNVAPDDPNLRFIDLNGDGRADILITEDRVFTCYESRGEDGFEAAGQLAKPTDERTGPSLVFADGTSSVYLADMDGDGLTDLVRVRNGEVCYWPSLGYGHFGRRVLMENSPRFADQDAFDQRRIRLTDIDGSGNTDIIYLGVDGVRLYFNQSGNGWTAPRVLASAPASHPMTAVDVIDLFGNGTACLVWSSALPGEAGRPIRYIDLMGGIKPHLLTAIVNNLGSETRIAYSTSATFYVRDWLAGQRWLTRVPFPVHVVERIDVLDRISGNRFVTRYAYHHGYFDGHEREFRGFGMVEQWDTEEFAALADPARPATNIDADSHVPPVLTRTWFHTGAYVGRDRVSTLYAGLTDSTDRGLYYREPAWRDDDVEAARRLLDDTVLPAELSLGEEREAARALRGSMLRQEVYGLDGPASAGHPYRVTEQNFTVVAVQRRGVNPHAVFHVHPREAIEYHYERNPENPRVTHTLTLDVDAFGNVLRSASIAYGRRQPDTSLEDAGDRQEQLRTHVVLSEAQFTGLVSTAGDWRVPARSEGRRYHLTGLDLDPGALRFTPEQVRQAAASAVEIGYETTPGVGLLQKRLTEHVRTLYRRDNMSGPLPLHEQQALGLVHESYRLALTPGIALEAFGGLADPSVIEDEGRYVHFAGDGNWWVPSGQVFYSPDPLHSPALELAYARAHFYQASRYRAAYHSAAVPAETMVRYDEYDLSVEDVRDPAGNRQTVGERDLDPNRPLARKGYDYRVLQPAIVMDANRNRSAAVFDALGHLAGTAMMGKPEESLGDSLEGFEPDLDPDAVRALIGDPLGLVDPLADPHLALGRATTRLLYDLFAYARTSAGPAPQPIVLYTIARETHDADLSAGGQSLLRHSFLYSDGLGREVQTKAQAEPGLVPMRDAVTGGIVIADRRPVMTAHAADPRWIGSGWTVYNNKGHVVRRFEPFFTDTHRFESDVRVGVSAIRCYDPLGRNVATIHPDRTWEKVVFDSWKQESWDGCDTVTIADPSADADVGGLFARLPSTAYQPTWSAGRLAGLDGPEARAAAEGAALHGGTPTTTYLDPLGRGFVAIAINRFRPAAAAAADPPVTVTHRTRSVLDIDGLRRQVIDAEARRVMEYRYDMLGNVLKRDSMDAGSRWTLADVAGNPVRTWDSRGHTIRIEYDALRRAVRKFVIGTDAAQSDPRVLGREMLFERTDFGEGAADDVALNLRLRMVRQCDGAGILRHEAFDFKGNLLSSTRQTPQDYQGVADWSRAVIMEPDVYRGTTAYDALGRPVSLVSPDGSVIRPAYNQANLLERVDVNLRGARDPAGDPVWTPFVTGVEYDERGQRLLIQYGNGAETRYAYDREMSRLVHLYTRRGAAFAGDCANPLPPPAMIAAPPAPPEAGPCGVQNLRYTYDPVGNVTHVRDAAQQTVYFRNQQVDASSEFTYDALYRLIAATGREHAGNSGLSTVPHSHDDLPRVGIVHPADGTAMARYRETYEYDKVGNVRTMRHRGVAAGASSWTRTFDHQEASALAPAVAGNRLTGTTVTAAGPGVVAEPYAYDVHGNCTQMPQLQVMAWDFRDRLRVTQRQAVNDADEEGRRRHGERTFYTYDASGQRIRKVTELASSTPERPVVKEERLYLGAFEIYRRGGGAPLERETLHVMDDKRRIAQVETRVDSSGTAPLLRYGFGNHLDSAALELDGNGQIISYEEYTPYGSTAVQSLRPQTETPNRYRFTAKERDEESGFSYHGGRYLAPWLGRWCSADPLGLVDAPNTYAYAGQNPVRLKDDTGLADDKPWYETAKEAAVVGTILGVRQGLAPLTSIINPTAMQSVTQDQIVANQLLAQGNYDGAIAVATGFPDYFEIHHEAAAIGATGGEEAAVMLGHATGFNQAVETWTGETRTGAPLVGFDRFTRGVDSGLRLTGTVFTVAGGVSAAGQLKHGLPFSSSRAMNIELARLGKIQDAVDVLVKEHPHLTAKNAFNAIDDLAPQGTSPRVSGATGEGGADVRFVRDDGTQVLRVEFKAMNDGQLRSFDAHVSHAAQAQAPGGVVVVQVPVGTDVSKWMARFWGNRKTLVAATDAESITKMNYYKNTQITIIDASGKVLVPKQPIYKPTAP